jgi:hypothetical protein
MIVVNTRPKNLSKKINELCSLEKIEIQNTHLSEIIPIKIDTDNGAYKKIFKEIISSHASINEDIRSLAKEFISKGADKLILS